MRTGHPGGVTNDLSQETSHVSASAVVWPGIKKARSPSDSRSPGLAQGLGPLVVVDAAPGDLPELGHTVLDEAGLRLLFADLAKQSRMLEATLRPTPLSRPRPVKRLRTLLLGLLERRVFGAQLKYEHAGLVWLDTLIATTGGVRLVRFEARS